MTLSKVAWFRRRGCEHIWAKLVSSDLLANVTLYMWSICTCGSGGFFHMACCPHVARYLRVSHCPHVARSGNWIVCQTVSQAQRAPPPLLGATLPSSSAQSLVPVSGLHERLFNSFFGGRQRTPDSSHLWLQAVLELLLTFKELFHLQNRQSFSHFTFSVWERKP